MNKPDSKENLLLMKPFMPPLEEFQIHLERIWESRMLTNCGTIHAEFERALCEYLGVKHICLFANGTLALMIALKALKLRGEVITTPFTSPATLQAIYWNNLKPVFADISEPDLNIDPSAIEAAITPDTYAILPVHIFGTPCDVVAIGQLARKYDLKVVYDAAHCFGVEIDGKSVCNSGELSILSFHATKVFNTFEGGAIVCHDEATKTYIDTLKNNGLDRDFQLTGYGVNGKLNEIQSAFGLCQLKYVDDIIAMRKAITVKYRELLSGIKGLKVLPDKEGVKHNYSYFPVLIDPAEFGAGRDELHDYLKKKNIVTRKYFFPLVSNSPEFNMYKTAGLPVAEKIANSILCLPLFHDISDDQIEAVVHAIGQLNKSGRNQN